MAYYRLIWELKFERISWTTGTTRVEPSDITDFQSEKNAQTSSTEIERGVDFA